MHNTPVQFICNIVGLSEVLYLIQLCFLKYIEYTNGLNTWFLSQFRSPLLIAILEKQGWFFFVFYYLKFSRYTDDTKVTWYIKQSAYLCKSGLHFQGLGRMNQDQFLLKWNNHQNNFVEVFSFLRTQVSQDGGTNYRTTKH